MGNVADVIAALRSLGQVTLHSTTIDVLPDGTAASDLTGWQDGAATEQFEAVKSLLGFEMVNLSITTRWRFNGEFISQFRVTVDGFIDKTHEVDITVSVLSQTLSNDDGVAEIVYEVALLDSHLLSGTNRASFRAKVTGDGGGMTLF
jgi:hypothetical protein